MRINMSGIYVNDQEKALQFYTDTLGFQVKHDIPMGEFRWITVVSREQPSGTELALEPDVHPAVKPYVAALAKDGIPCMSFEVDDVAAEHQRLESLGVRFTQAPKNVGGSMIAATFEDTVGNLIMITQGTFEG